MSAGATPAPAAVLPELLPCPFCAGRGSMCHRTVFGTLRLARVECIGCGARGPEIEFRLRVDAGPQDEAEWEAAASWNRRDKVRRAKSYWTPPAEPA